MPTQFLESDTTDADGCDCEVSRPYCSCSGNTIYDCDATEPYVRVGPCTHG